MTAVVFDQISGERKPQADARLYGRDVRLEDLPQRFRRDARAGVGDREAAALPYDSEVSSHFHEGRSGPALHFSQDNHLLLLQLAG